MADRDVHARDFEHSVEWFRDAEKSYVRAAREGDCDAAHKAWTALVYYFSQMEEQYADIDPDLTAPDATATRELGVSRRTLDRITPKLTTQCVKAI
jgi:hypothetical protein